MNAPHTEFGETKLVPVVVYLNGDKIKSETWDETLWVERGEDYYALSTSGYRNKKIRVVERSVWLRCPEL